MGDHFFRTLGVMKRRENMKEVIRSIDAIITSLRSECNTIKIYVLLQVLHIVAVRRSRYFSLSLQGRNFKNLRYTFSLKLIHVIRKFVMTRYHRCHIIYKKIRTVEGLEIPDEIRPANPLIQL